MRLAGQYHNAESGLHQNRWRSFDPSTGRYLSPDPLGLAGGLNLYAYAEQDPIGNTDPLGLFPGIGDLTAHVLGAKAGSQASQAYSQVQNLMHPHLSAATPPFLPTGPSPFGPNGLGSLPGMKPLGAALPTYNLPGLPAPVNLGSLNAGSLFNQGINGPLPLGHLHAQHTKHLRQTAHHAPAHHAPPPAQPAHSCTPKPLPAHRHTSRPAPLPSDTTPIITVRDFFGGVGTGFRNIWDFRRGTEQASEDMINPVKIYQGTQALGGQIATLVPGADGQKADPGVLARKLGGGFVESVNPFDKQNAYDIGYSTANAAAVVLPVAGEVSALNDLRLGVKAATAEEGAARVAVASAKGPSEAAEASARLARAQAGVLKAQAALKARLPGADVRKVAAKAQAAGRRLRERRAGGTEPSEPNADADLYEQNRAANVMKARWAAQGRGQHSGPRQPALAAAGGRGNGPTSRPIGRPGPMQMAKGASKNTSVPANSKYAGGPRVIPKTNPHGGHLPADFDLHTIAESPQEQRLFQKALKNKAASRSPRLNAYQRYLQEIKEGQKPTYDQANEAWGVVQQEYFKLCRNAGINMDGVQVHHWNFNKGEFPLQATDPRNLVHTPDRQTSWNSHQAVHEATSSTSDIWSGPVDDTHQIPVDTNVFPLAPPEPPTTPH